MKPGIVINSDEKIVETTNIVQTSEGSFVRKHVKTDKKDKVTWKEYTFPLPDVSKAMAAKLEKAFRFQVLQIIS